MDEKKPTHPGLSYCVECRTVKFEAEVAPKEALQKHEIAEPMDGSFWAFCRVCKSIEGISLLAGFLGIPLSGTTKHRSLKAALHVPSLDPDGIRREPMRVEVEERTTTEPKGAPEGKKPVLTPQEEAQIKADVESALKMDDPTRKPPEDPGVPKAP